MTPKIALVYDWVNTTYGGAEQVLLALHQLYPQAPLYTAVYDQNKASWAKDFQIHTSFLQHFPFAKSHHRWFVPLLPLAFESFDFSQFDIIISITSSFAKGILTQPKQLHLCYMLTPPRYVYSHQQTYLKGWHNWPIIKQIINLFHNYLLWWDQASSARPDFIIPISKRVQERIKLFYDKEAKDIIYPPVAPASKPMKLPPWLIEWAKTPFWIIVSRLVEYKRVDQAILACQKLNQHLLIIGSGTDESNLKKLLTDNNDILMIGSQSDSFVSSSLSLSQGLLMIGEEDFGITGLEAIQAGKPVLVHQKSGVAELIEDNLHGIQLKDDTIEEVIKGLQKLSALKTNSDLLKQQATRYSTNIFKLEFSSLVEKLWQTHQQTTAI